MFAMFSSDSHFLIGLARSFFSAGSGAAKPWISGQWERREQRRGDEATRLGYKALPLAGAGAHGRAAGERAS